MPPLVSAVLEHAARLRRSDDGQDLLEYGLLAALIAVAALGAAGALGAVVGDVFWGTIAAAF